jgi:hypothetical protein
MWPLVNYLQVQAVLCAWKIAHSLYPSKTISSINKFAYSDILQPIVYPGTGCGEIYISAWT